LTPLDVQTASELEARSKDVEKKEKDKA